MEYILLFISKYLLGYLLQDFIILLGVYTFSKIKIERRSFLLILCMLVPTNIIVRMLPISYGINILLNDGIILFATYKLCHLELYSIIRSTLLSTLLVLLNELVCFGTLLAIYGQEKADMILQTPILKASIYVPFNIALGGIIFYCYLKMVKRNY